MSKVITFSAKFPSYHSKAGQSTHFVEKFYNSLFARNNLMDYPKGLDIDESILDFKNHTIRAGNRFNEGDYFSPRVWGNNINLKSGRKGAYHSKQIILCGDIEIKKVWNFEIKDECIFINNELYAYSSSTDLIDKIALNDGLTHMELLQWFKYPKPFKGQIICWNEMVKY